MAACDKLSLSYRLTFDLQDARDTPWHQLMAERILIELGL